MSLGFIAGRRREVERLLELASRTSEEGPCLAVVEGPRGVGKHALVSAFVDEARRDGALVLEARVQRGAPFSPIDGLIEEALALLGRTPRGVELGCARGCHALWFNHPVAGQASPERALEAQRVHFDSVRRLFIALGRLGRTIVVVRGLASASADVVALLSHLITEPETGGPAPRLLVVGVVEDGGPADLSPLMHHPRTARVALRGLDEEALRTMLTSPEVIARILACTDGAPDAVGRFLATEAPSPEAYLAERASRLGPEARSVLDALAVVGAPAPIVDLARLAGTPLSSEVVAELEGALLAETTDGELGLSDPMDGPRALAKLPPDRRRALHLRAAELSAGRRHYAQAARQALAGGAPPLAAQHACDAAAALGARQAHREAAALLKEIRAGLDGDERARLDGPLADALLSAGEFGAAVPPARRAWEISKGNSAAGRRLSRALVLSGSLDEAERVLRLTEDLAREAGDPAGAVALEGILAELCYQAGRFDDAERLAEKVIDADGIGPEVRLDARQTHAKVALARGDLAEAEARYREYELAACAAGSTAHEALAVGGLGVALITCGDLPAAERALARCARLAERARDRKAQALAQHNLAVASHLRHDYATARERYEEAIRLLSLVGNRSSLARAAYNLGELYETFGAYARARSMCDFGAQAGGPEIAPRATAEGLLLRGRVAFAEDDLPGARIAFEAAHSVLEALDPIRAVAAAAGLARVSVREDRPGDAEALLDGIARQLAATRRADVALARAELAEARGSDVVGAARHAVEVAGAADEERLLQEALVGLARVLFEHGAVAEARRALARAVEVDAAVRPRVPRELLSDWEDRPVRRTMLALMASGRTARAERRASTESGRLGIIGDSAAMRRVRRIIDRAGPSDCNVLLRGESGTGKELAARALHRVSPRADGPLVAVNCAAIVETLLLNELFGHEKGAFTGATGCQIGRFEQAHGGTLFLDEIGDISLAVQAALLRVLSERSFERVGGRETIRVDVRVIAATNRDLESMIREGTFREDLYYRLNELSIALPPLRDRRDDVSLLAEHVLSQIAAERGEAPKRLSRRALAALARHPWPGNVRQLENALRAATLFADGDEVAHAHLDLKGIARTMGQARESASGPVPGDEVELCYERLRVGGVTLRDLKKEIERDLIERALVDSDGNISRAAELLGMKRPRLSQLVKEYGLRQTGDDS